MRDFYLPPENIRRPISELNSKLLYLYFFDAFIGCVYNGLSLRAQMKPKVRASSKLN